MITEQLPLLRRQLGGIYKELNKNLTTIKVLGPYAIGPEGYDSPEEAVFYDPSFSGSLYEPDTWEED